jgi:hypothetical protein
MYSTNIHTRIYKICARSHCKHTSAHIQVTNIQALLIGLFQQLVQTATSVSAAVFSSIYSTHFRNRSLGDILCNYCFGSSEKALIL